MSGDFWSRRKAGVEREALAEEAALLSAEKERLEAARADMTDAELLAEANLPAPETLDSPEAVREFMASALPQRLKTIALRRLWRMNPVLANLDGLIDYGEDFTDSATVIENLQTAYQVGKGMLKHVEEMARQDALAADDSEPEEVPATETVTAREDFQPEEPVATPNEVPDLALSDHSQPDLPPQPRRRMVFTFDEQRAG